MSLSLHARLLLSISLVTVIGILVASLSAFWVADRQATAALFTAAQNQLTI